jgi:hypothetical protein
LQTAWSLAWRGRAEISRRFDDVDTLETMRG